MRAMTKSAVRLARTALLVGEEALPRYAARTSRHDWSWSYPALVERSGLASQAAVSAGAGGLSRRAA